MLKKTFYLFCLGFWAWAFIVVPLENLLKWPNVDWPFFGETSTAVDVILGSVYLIGNIVVFYVVYRVLRENPEEPAD
jgi:hypothetical protein